MKRRSLPARLWALAAAASLVFAQVAMAAFAPPSRTAAMVEARVEGAPCHREDPAVQHLCIKKNCQDEAQKHDVPVPVVAGPPPSIALRTDFPRDEIPRDTPESLLARATSPPVAIAFARRLE